MKTLVANWKMELGVRESVALARGVLRGLRGVKEVPNVYVAPSHTALTDVAKVLGRSRVMLAAQDMHRETQGAYTGFVSAKQLKEVGAQAVILAAKVHALLQGRFNVALDDVDAVAHPAMRHRILLNFEGEAEGMKTDTLVDSMIAAQREAARPRVKV